MEHIQLYENFINEARLHYKTLDEFISYVKKKNNKTWIWFDTETTGLGGPKIDQITQMSAIATKNGKIIDQFDKRMELTKGTTDKIKKEKEESEDGKSRTEWVLKDLTNYYDKSYEYEEESSVLPIFLNWVNSFKDVMFVIQNASFDMKMLAVRSKQFNLKYDVFDLQKYSELFVIPTLEVLGQTDVKIAKKLEVLPISKRTGLRSASMNNLPKYFDINQSGQHSSLADVKLMIEYFNKSFDILQRNKTLDILEEQKKRYKLYRS